MAVTNEIIATSAVGASPVATVTISSIPQTFTDLLVIMSVNQNAGSAQAFYLRTNTDTNGNGVLLSANGTSISPGAGTSGGASQIGNVQDGDYTANTFTAIQAYIPNYTSTDVHGVSAEWTAENNATATTFGIFAMGMAAGAINSITIAAAAGSFIQNSMFSVYGIKKGTGGATSAQA
jgi:hypothetical protein